MEKNTLKEAELKLVVELMKNSRRSDRELAKATGLSQPTVSRLRMKLEKGEYTMIPDFEKLGYEILAITFVKLGKNLEPEQIDEARRIAKEDLEKTPFAVVMLERGLGLKYDGVIVAFYEDYVAYSKHMDVLKQYSFLETSEIESFLISLKDTVRYRPLTFKSLAEHLLTWKQNKK